MIKLVRLTGRGSENGYQLCAEVPKKVKIFI